jgi:acetyl esterase
VRAYGPFTRGDDVLVWVHGGSWSHGSVEAWHPAYVELQRSLPLTLIAARYRSSHEASHPAQLIDVQATLRAVRGVIGEANLLAGGDSAGGTLVAHAASASSALVDAQLLAYPPMDPTCASPTYDDTTEFPSRGWMRAAWAAYAGSATPEGLASASPLSAPPHARVAPTSLLVGTRDPVRGDVEAYASLLRGAGVATQIMIRDDVCHGDFLRVGRNPVRDWIVTATRRHLHAGREGARQ